MKSSRGMYIVYTKVQKKIKEQQKERLQTVAENTRMLKIRKKF